MNQVADRIRDLGFFQRLQIQRLMSNMSGGQELAFLQGDNELRTFAKETGGQAYFPFKVEDLEQDFANIANVLRHQYIILYRPDPLVTDGLFHPLTLRVKGQKGLIVYVRPGYYAPKM